MTERVVSWTVEGSRIRPGRDGYVGPVDITAEARAMLDQPRPAHRLDDETEAFHAALFGDTTADSAEDWRTLLTQNPHGRR